MEIQNIDLEALKGLYFRLLQDYNDGIEFVQYEEDRIEIAKVIEFLMECEK